MTLKLLIRKFEENIGRGVQYLQIFDYTAPFNKAVALM